METDFVSVQGVRRSFGEVAAVDNVDISVRQGELLALLGPSGCGKTTLLRIIGGLEVPDAGTIRVGGEVLNGPSTFVPPERRRVVMVFQDFALFPHMDVAANVAFGLGRGANRRQRVAGLLELVGLTGLEKRMPHQLSGGQQQRVALARALAPNPRLILLDEPFSNLDPSIRARVRHEVQELIRAVGITAIFVTHDQEEALSLADDVAVMMNGRVLQCAPPREIYANPATRTVAEFVGQANFLSGEVRDGLARCAAGCFPVDVAFTGPADVMVRTEEVELAPDGVAATVNDVSFLGGDQVVTLTLPSGEPLVARLRSAGPLADGDIITIRVRGNVRAFPAAP